MSQTPQLLSSSLLSREGFSHGFFTRVGGVSSGEFSSLSFATGSGDSIEHLKENLRIAGALLEVPGSSVFFLNQVHGVGHFIVNEESRQEAAQQTDGDIVLSNTPALAAAIRTADCVPILLACRRTGWVCACHSGWQGCVQGAANTAISLMRKNGATDIIAAIGPHISAHSFEVSEDVAQELVSASPEKRIADRSREKPHVDLRAMVTSQLMHSGLDLEQIDHVRGCTVIEEERFFSFRRDGNPSGRMLSAIVARNS